MQNVKKNVSMVEDLRDTFAKLNSALLKVEMCQIF